MTVKAKFRYIARKAGKYGGKLYRRGQEVKLIGGKWDEILVEQAHGTREVAQPFLKAVPVENASLTGEYTHYTIRQLRQMCKDKSLPVYGKKADLVARLEGSDT